MATVDEDCNDTVAHLPGVRAAVYDTAEEGASQATAVLAAHHHLGHARITVTRGELDAFVSLDDERGQHAAAAIEYGRSGGDNGSASQGINALGSAFR